MLFQNIPTVFSSQVIRTISIHKDYVKIYPLTIDATLLNYNSFHPDRIGNNGLNSTLIQQENLIGTRNRTQQNIQTPSHFKNEEIIKTKTTTAQQSISPIHPKSYNSKFFNFNQSTHGDRGQTQFCRNLIANLFKKGISPCTAEFPEVKIKRQILYHYLKGICNITHQHGIYTIEIKSPSTFHGRYLLQTDDVDIEFSKVFTEYIKNIQHQNSQGANSVTKSLTMNFQ